ncbi:MAG: PadR family transcriptional regulator [Candidatus Njordarchaeales archaeon]
MEYHHSKRFDKTSLRAVLRGVKELLILSIIKERPVHGSEIQKILKERYGLDIPKPIVYMLLRRMEEEGYIISQWEIGGSGPAKRVYRITDEGLDHLNYSIELLEKLKKIIEDVLKEIRK